MKPTVYFATDHAGFTLKEALVPYVRDELGYVVVDCGARQFVADDDYPDFIGEAARHISKHPSDRAIIFGGSGQGEAMAANRFLNVRAALFYGNPPLTPVDEGGMALSLLEASRIHNDANILSLGARFVSLEEAKAAVKLWLATPFSNDDRHMRRIRKLEQLRR
jgi:ribose 5-phosphate isomerase B